NPHRDSDLGDSIQREREQLTSIIRPLEDQRRLKIKMIEGEKTLKQLFDLGNDYKPNIVHIIGHGRREHNELLIDLEGADRVSDPRGYTDIHPVLQRLSAELGLVFLNTCTLGLRSSETPSVIRSGRSIDPEFAPLLVTRLGIPA